jgi:adenine-specific DNA methylase
MFYVKVMYQGKLIQVDISGRPFYTQCVNCGKEIELDDDLFDEVLRNGDLLTTTISCCSTKPKLQLVKG